VRLFIETQSANACVSEFDGKVLIGVELHISIINLLLIRCDGWGAATMPP
jgi:hypothetical protein